MSDTDTTNYGIADVDKQTAIAAVRAAAWDEGQDCPTCHGDGRVPGGRRAVHCIGGFTGADWDVEGVVAEIENGARVCWIDDWRGHDLVVGTADSKQWRFQVERPEGVLPREVR